LSAYSDAIYRTFLSWPEESAGNKECVHIARMQPGDDEREFYVKLYPGEQGKSRGLINEIIGYLVLHGMAVPQPPVAFLARIPVDDLLAPKQQWLRNFQGKGVAYWGFCSEKVPGRAAAIHFSGVAKALLTPDMERWEKLPVALAADENIAHTDRHFKNVIRLAEGQYAMIDNGRLISEARNWKRSELKRDKLYRHRLSEHLWNHCPPNTIASGTALWAKTASVSFASIQQELEYWLGLFKIPMMERKALLEFLLWRASNLEDLIKKRFNLLV
jgi:hypothetical protein